jgi:adenine phosphoribosyltransferase
MEVQMSKALKTYIRDIPDFPKPGILFRDITTLLKDKTAFKKAIDELAGTVDGKRIDYVVAVESRGFIFGAALAYKLGVGFIPVRKKGKLPAETVSADYSLEYGTDSLEMHKDALYPNANVLIIDDLLATGGTAEAVCRLVKEAQAKISDVVFLIELCALKGREKLNGVPIHSLIQY